MDRKTKTIKLPSGKETVIKDYLTAGEKREIRNIYIDALKPEFNIKGLDEAQNIEMSSAVITQAENKLIEMTVISYDGGSEKILERLLDGSAEDFDALMSEVGKLNQNFQQAK